MIPLKYIILLLTTITLIACNDNDNTTDTPIIPPPTLNINGLDFSNYVAIGASFTSGFTDGALFRAGQENSFPNSLSKQFAKANGGNFNQPLMEDNTGGLLLGGSPIPNIGYRFVFNGETPQRLNELLTEKGAPVPLPKTDVAINLNSTFNNMGVPGIKSFHLTIEGYGALNPYFGRMATSPTTSIINDVMAKQPTFFTLSEIGGNDVLSYAISGGTGSNQNNNPDPTTYGVNDITSPLVFETVFKTITATLTSKGAKGIVTTVPYITYLPHFTTVPYNPIPMDTTTAKAVNQAYITYNDGLKQVQGLGAITEEELNKRTITFAEGQNAVVIIDENLTDLTSYGLPNYRQATNEDLFVLASSSFIGTLADPSNPATVNGVGIPLADKWVLTPEEQFAIKTATDAYNASITEIANTNNSIALLDLNTILQQAATTGIVFDNYTLTTDLVTGGLVSLDGIHLTSRGYALMANKFLEVIDATFGSNFIASQTVTKAINYPTNYPINMP